MDLLIFDLDGTLIDSKRDLVNAVNATRVDMGLKKIDAELVSSYVGNGAPVLIRRALGPEASQEEVDRALAFFLGYYREHMLDYTKLYPGVGPALDRMRDSGVQMAVLTNKPVRFSQALVDGLGVGKHFFRVYGGNSFDFKKPHPVGVERLLQESRADRARSMMVGDSAVDIQTARAANISACGVTYGLQPETLRDAPPDLLIDRMEQLAEYVLAAQS